MSQIKVPEGMLKAAVRVGTTRWDNGYLPRALEAALMWLSEHPIVPTWEQCEEIGQELNATWSIALPKFIAKWQGRMFLSPELESCWACDHGQSLERGEGTHIEGTRQHPAGPEVPEAIKDLLWKPDGLRDWAHLEQNRNLLEAYHRGQKAKP